jgi:hypothetical protein
MVLQVGMGLPLALKIFFVTKYFKAPRTRTDSLARHRQWKKEMRSGIWNARNLCRVGTVRSVVGELEKYKLDLMTVQEFRREGEGY